MNPTMRSLALLPLLVLCACVSAEPTTPTVVFKATETSPHPSIRIPALLCTAKGTLIAVAEGRDRATDQAGNDLIVSLSTDNGRTWSKAAIAHEQGNDSLNNPCLVQDAKSGKVFLIYQFFPAGTHEFGKEGLAPGPKGSHRICYVSSTDEGRSWSKPVDITESIKPDEATTTASGPGVGIQIQGGKHKGRLVIPFNSQGPKGFFVNWVAYSDDGGKIWKRGANVPQEKMQLNEVQVCETSDGGLYLNSRKWSSGPNGRRVAWSNDGGQSWSPAKADNALPEPVCQGCLLRVPGAKPRLVFLNPQGEPAGKGRKVGTLRLSSDDGRTWDKARVLVPGKFAYSSMALMKNNRIGVLYEPDDSKTLLFTAVDVAWIEKGE